MQLTVQQLFDTMLEHMGPQGWWPAQSKWEIILGAVLVQNTNWNNVERSLRNLYDSTAFDPLQLSRLSLLEWQAAIRPSGFQKNKSRALFEVFQWLADHDFDLDRIQQRYGKTLRPQLLKMFGIGHETADVLLVYVFDRVEFIADKYAQKLFTALQITEIKDYRSLKRIVTLPVDFTVDQAQEFHGLIDEFGKLYLNRSISLDRTFLDGKQLLLQCVAETG